MNNQTENKMNERSGGTTPAIYPVCRFCGNVQMPVGKYNTQEEADEAATLRCDCFDARNYRIEVEQKKRREENVEKLRQNLNEFSSYCQNRGVELQGDLRETIFNAGVSVLDNIVLNVSFKFARMKVTISKNGKGALVIAFVYSDGARVEV